MWLNGIRVSDFTISRKWFILHFEVIIFFFYIKNLNETKFILSLRIKVVKKEIHLLRKYLYVYSVTYT